MNKALPWPQNLIVEVLGKVDFVFEQDHQDGLDIALSTLKPKEEKLVRMRFQNMMKLREIGEHEGFSSEYARLVINQGLRKLKHPWRLNYIQWGCRGVLLLQNPDIASSIVTLESPIDMLELSNGSYNSISRHFLLTAPSYRTAPVTIRDLVTLSKEELSRFPRMGKVSVDEVIFKLAKYGFRLRDERTMQQNGSLSGLINVAETKKNVLYTQERHCPNKEIANITKEDR